MFSENTSQKAFNTKYHEGTKDKKIEPKNKFNPKNAAQ
jgi:hypothetical protein